MAERDLAAQELLDLTTKEDRAVEHVDLEGERHRLTLEALADVDAGRFVDHRAVQAWADSLSSECRLPG